MIVLVLRNLLNNHDKLYRHFFYSIESLLSYIKNQYPIQTLKSPTIILPILFTLYLL